MSTATIGLGMIGCGWAAGEIARAAAHLSGLQIVTVFDTDSARATALAARTAARTAEDIDVVLFHPDVQAVYVGVPHALIAPIVARAIAAGKHVIAEKPLALDPSEARRLAASAEAAGLTLSVFFELRRSATVGGARDLIAAGEIGEPLLIRLRTIIDKRPDYWGAPGAPNWRASRALAGGGVLLMNTIHQLDTVRYLTGLDYESATGEIATLGAGVEVEDAGSATLRLSNGGLLNIVATAHSPGAREQETIEIDGSLGRLDLPDPFGTAPLRLYRRSTAAWVDMAVERRDSHLLMLESILAAIRGEASVPASGADAAAAVAAVNAIYRSAGEGGRIAIA